MANPFAFIEEIREMNEILTSKLEEIIKRLEILIEIESEGKGVDWYGDGK